MKKIDHVGIAVKNLEETLKIYQQGLGLKVGEVEVVAEQKVKVASLPIGESRIELLESTDPEGAVAKFIENRGEGIHHIALRVENIELALQKLKDRGIQLINEKPKLGAHGFKIAFIHPKSTKGVLIELCEGK